MENGSRRQYSAEQKIAILREHLLEQKLVSDVCESHQINPTQFYQWQKQLFENGAKAFEPKPRSQFPSKDEAKIAALEAKLKKKDEVIAEIMADHIVLKKSLGEI